MGPTEDRIGGLAQAVKNDLEKQGVLTEWAPDADNKLRGDVGGEPFRITVERD